MLFILSSSVLFFVPYGTKVFFSLGISLISFFVITLYIKRSDVNFDKISRLKGEIVLFLLLIGLLSFSFIPSALGTIALFAILHCFYFKGVEFSDRFVKGFLTLVSIVLTYNIYGYVFDKSLVLTDSNSNYLAILFLFLFLISKKFKFIPGEVLAIIAALVLGVRNLQLAMAVFYIFSFKNLYKHISLRSIFIFFFLANISYFAIGSKFSRSKLPYPVVDLKNFNVSLGQKSINELTSHRVELNNDFFRTNRSDMKSALLGKGKDYTGNKIIARVMPVHNSWLILIARHGVAFTFLYLMLFYRFSSRFFLNNERIIISYFTFATFLHGAFETFPFLALISLYILNNGNKKISRD